MPLPWHQQRYTCGGRVEVVTFECLIRHSDYPWRNMTSPLKKWLFLTQSNQQILDKNLLCGKFGTIDAHVHVFNVTCLLICLYVRVYDCHNSAMLHIPELTHLSSSLLLPLSRFQGSTLSTLGYLPCGDQ